MKARWVFGGLLLATFAVVPGLARQGEGTVSVLLPTGKAISPGGTHAGVGSYPVNMVLSPDGKYAVVTNSGFRQYLTVVRVPDGSVVDRVAVPVPDGIYYGLAFGAESSGSGVLYVSHGARDRISRWHVGADGKLERIENADLLSPGIGKGRIPYHPAGIAVSPDGAYVFVANNLGAGRPGLMGSYSIYHAAAGTLVQTVGTAGFPLAIEVVEGPKGTWKVYVASERDGTVTVYSSLDYGKAIRVLRTGAQPSYMLKGSPKSHLLYVSNAGSDTISVIDTRSDHVVSTILVRPAALSGIPGTTPLGMALSPDEQRIYVALADLSAVGVIDLRARRLIGYLPTGWYPTSLVANPDGTGLVVASAKGIKARNPNSQPVGEWGTYDENIIEGTVSHVSVPADADLPAQTALVLQNNGAATAPKDYGFKNPGIKYVVYVIKENRTYDQVLGDVAKGNGDPKLCMFPREVTPNQHALVERFALLDNFYVCAEVSYDGWQWSTSGMVTPYTSRNAPYNYSGRGRDYDSEGENSGVAVDLEGIPDVAKPACGYIWEQCLKHHVPMRNYGVFVQSADPADKRFTATAGKGQAAPNKLALIGKTCPDFRWYDNAYADSDAWFKHHSPFPKQLKAFGAGKQPSRFSAWKKEFDRYVARGEMPRFQIVRFPQDHTAGSRDGFASPRAMVADNDYAVGQLVDAISHSKFWQQTLIVVLEDDAQSGTDHVDCHRSTGYAISPFIRPGTLSSQFYNTDSMLRTIELVLGIPPMNQYDAVARPLLFFGADPSNSQPYDAILPAKGIVGDVNTKTAYRSKDSERLFPRFVADPGFDAEQNDVLRGATSARPR